MKTVFWPYLIRFFRLRTIRGLVGIGLGLSLSLTISAELPLQTKNFPVLTKLQRGDTLFDQLSSDLSVYYKARARNQTPPSLTLMRYTVAKGESLFTISARLNLPHSTLATLNHLSHPSKIAVGLELIIPNLPGIYLPIAPKSGIEQLLTRRLQDRSSQAVPIRFESPSKIEEFLFFPSEDFSPQERRAFLGSLFVRPLPAYRISSPYGPRKNPISGQIIHHDGIDLVAPLGSAVLAASDGVVIEEGYDPVYGNFIIIDHGGGYESVYGHLLKFIARKGQQLSAGELIGKVGVSGQSTGAHLHFEIHFNGVPKDPAPFLRGLL